METVPFTSRRSTAKSVRTQSPTDHSVRDETGDSLVTPIAGLGILTEIWQRILHVEGTKREDNFFELGGTSLQAMLMASRLLKATGVEISLARFFDDPTFGALSEAVFPAAKPDGEPAAAAP